MTEKAKDTIIGISVLLTCFVIFAIWQTNSEKKKYKEKGILTIGTVIKVEDDYKKRPEIYYTFNVAGKSYSGNNAYPEFLANIEEELKNKTFPVIYIKDNPDDSYILISRTKFKKNGIPFPDSLRWTIKLEFP